MNSGGIQDLIRVDVADTCDELGIHEHLLDAAFPAGEKLFEPGKRELRIERFRTELPDLGSIENDLSFAAERLSELP